MARPQNKSALIEAANENYTKLLVLIESMNEQELNTSFDFSQDIKKKEAHWKRDKNLRDVIMHLHEWHNLVINWIENNKSGVRKQFLMEGYNWKTYGDMNNVFWQNCQQVTLDDAMKRFELSHKKVMELINEMSNEELFSKGIYPWVGGSTIGAYFIGSTSSHYEWAMKKIKAHKRKVNKC